MSDPDQRLSGMIMTVDTLKREAELKILLGCTPAEQQQILQIINNGAQAGILLERPESL